MKLGIFGGAFNPVHNGHINLAKKYIDILGLDKLLVIPTANPPHREGNDFADAAHRMKMLELAFADVEKAEISDIEFRLGGKSYTFNTIEGLRSVYENAEIYLIVGEDQFLSFDKWYRYSEILERATLCTAQRNNDKEKELKEFAQNVLKTDKYVLAAFDPVVVSSSEIRQKLKNNEKVDDLVPKKVLNYIFENGLYCR